METAQVGLGYRKMSRVMCPWVVAMWQVLVGLLAKKKPLLTGCHDFEKKKRGRIGQSKNTIASIGHTNNFRRDVLPSVVSFWIHNF